jgi:hypothetical protein
MKFLKTHLLFEKNTADKTYYSPKNIVSEICISMVLLNNEFLDNILDRGLKARYSENSQIFLTDLKNLLLAKNRLMLGKFYDGKFIKDDDISKINGYFNEINFEIEKNWDILTNSRLAARAIIDKLLPDEKVNSELISKIYWIGPNKNEDIQEDIVIELNTGKQYSIYLNKNVSLQRSASFNTFADDLIGNEIDNLFKEDYINKWDKLAQSWIKLVYENASKSIQSHIEKFIDTNRIESIGYFEYFDIRHRDPKFKFLGEYLKEFEKNILKFSELMNEIWKKREMYFMDVERVEKEWNEIRITILNSRILEHLFTTSLKKNNPDEIKKLESGMKKSAGKVKMKLVKTLVEKIGCIERDVIFVSKNGVDFIQLPSRQFFRDAYDDIDILFDYHVKFQIEENSEDNNDFKFKMIMNFKEQELLKMNIVIGFSGGEFSSKLNAKYKFELNSSFGYLISKNEEQ